MFPQLNLYESDFYAWCEHQVALLLSQHHWMLDVTNLAEELRSMANHEAQVVEHALEALLTHMLMYAYAPGRHHPGHQGRSSLLSYRHTITESLKTSPSLRRLLPTLLPMCYTDAIGHAADHLHLPVETFPTACPWTLDQVLDDGFAPPVQRQEGQETLPPRLTSSSLDDVVHLSWGGGRAHRTVTLTPDIVLEERADGSLLGITILHATTALPALVQMLRDTQAAVPTPEEDV
jgi:hypothetical protein